MDEQELWAELFRVVTELVAQMWHDEVLDVVIHARRLGQIGPLPLPLPLLGRMSAQPTAPPPVPPDEPTPPPDTTDMPADTEAAFLAVLQAATYPLKGRTVANRASRQYGSHAREVLARLVADGRVQRALGGYWLASRPLPRADS